MDRAGIGQTNVIKSHPKQGITYELKKGETPGVVKTMAAKVLAQIGAKQYHMSMPEECQECVEDRVAFCKRVKSAMSSWSREERGHRLLLLQPK